jgi:hypothetical protein
VFFHTDISLALSILVFFYTPRAQKPDIPIPEPFPKIQFWGKHPWIFSFCPLRSLFQVKSNRGIAVEEGRGKKNRVRE